MIRLTNTLRPRWTLRYVLFSAAVLYSTYCILLGMPFFSSRLPPYTGQYEVGVVDLELPCETRKISDAVVKKTGTPMFELETVLFSLYYPAVPGVASRAPHHPWVSSISTEAEGYARFARINNVVTNNFFSFALWMLVGSTTIPAKVDVPLHGSPRTYVEYKAESPADGYGLPSFPVIVFSHGMASSRTSYSQYCAELASRGLIVAAIEHRDGSGPGSIVRSKEGSRTVFHATPESLSPTLETADFKTVQLAMRQAEVEETVRVLREINKGMGQKIFETNLRKEGQDLAQWSGRLMMKRTVIAGHSFGATLALQTLKGGPSEALPFVGCVALDPGKQSGALNDNINVPTLVVHSQSWSAKHTIFHGRPHFTVVKDLVRKIIDEKKKFAWFVTAKGTTHPSVTDAPLIEPLLLSCTTGSKLDSREAVMQYVNITRQFMNFLNHGRRQSILSEEVTHEEYDSPNPRPYNPSVSKYWQVHMSPTAKCPAAGYCGLNEPDD